MRVAGLITGTLFTEFGTDISLDNLAISETYTLMLPPGDYDFLYYSGVRNIIDREQTEVPDTGLNLDIVDGPQHEVVIQNNTGRDFTEMRYGVDYALINRPVLGGDIIRDASPLKAGKSYRFMLPYESWDIVEEGVVILKDTAGGYYFRDLTADRTNWLEEQDEFIFNNTNPPTSVTLNYGGNAKLCNLEVFRNEQPPKNKLDLFRAAQLSVDIFELTNHAPLSTGSSFTFKLEPGAYFIRAYDCNGKLVRSWNNKVIKGLSTTLNVVVPCTPPGTVKVGEGGLQSILESVDLQCGAAVDGFAELQRQQRGDRL